MPLWKKTLYGYQYSGEEASAQNALRELLQSAKDGDLELVQAAEALCLFSDAPLPVKQKGVLLLAWLKAGVNRLLEGKQSRLTGARLLYLSTLLSFCDEAPVWREQGEKMVLGQPSPKRTGEEILYSCLM